MVIVGFGFTKIAVERTKPVEGKINIKNNVTIKLVEQKELALGNAKKEGIRFEFEFTSEYEPKIGTISIIGEIISMEEPAKVKEIMKSWEKEKRIPKEIMTGILNNILNKCNIQALILSQDVNLPAPIPLPTVQVQEKAEKNK